MSAPLPMDISKADVEPSVWYKLAQLYGPTKTPENSFGAQIEIFMPKEGGDGKLLESTTAAYLKQDLGSFLTKPTKTDDLLKRDDN